MAGKLDELKEVIESIRIQQVFHEALLFVLFGLVSFITALQEVIRALLIKTEPKWGLLLTAFAGGVLFLFWGTVHLLLWIKLTFFGGGEK